MPSRDKLHESQGLLHQVLEKALAMSISVAKRNDVLFVTLNAGPKGNRLSNASAIKLAELLETAVEERLVVLASEGPEFCVGRDFGGSPDRWTDLSAVEVRERNTEPVLRMLAAIRRSRMPVMTVVQGKAIGVGVSIAAVSDMAIASDAAAFQLPEMDHGIPPCLVMSALAGRILPQAIMQMVYSNEAIDAARARDIGIVSDVVPAPGLQARVDEMVARIASQPIRAVRAVKEYMRSAPGMDAQGAADFASSLLAGVLSSPSPRAAT